MSSTVTALTCGACGRRFAWRPEYAGKTLRCKCGQPIKVPAAVPAATSGAAKQSAPAPAKKAAPAKQPAAAAAAAAPAAASSGGADFADLFGSAQADYEMAPPLTPPSQRPATVAAPAAIPRPNSSPLGYAGMLRKQPVDQGAGNGLAVTSLVLGIVSCAMFWFCTPWLPRGLGVLAIIFGLRAITQGAGAKAKAGLILGIVGIVATFLFWIVISNAADRIGKSIQQNAEQWQKQAEQMRKEAEEAQRKAEEQMQRENPTTQPAGVRRSGTLHNP
jgi:hypothetical protein